MVQVNTEITGLRELARNADKLSKNVAQNVLKSALRRAGRVVVKAARAGVERRRTGLLKSAKGINLRVRRAKKNGVLDVDIGWTRDAFYGGQLELGNSRQAAEPHLRPGLEENIPEIDDEFIGQMNKTIERTLGRIRG